MSYVKGDSVRFYKGSDVLDLELEVSLMANLDTIETTVKGNNFKTFLSGDKTWEVSAKANLDWTKDYNISQTFADLTAGNQIAISIGNGSNYYSGGALLTSWTLEAAHNDLGKISFTCKGMSALVETNDLASAIPYIIPFTIS